jgi:hypothetical protein
VAIWIERGEFFYGLLIHHIHFNSLLVTGDVGHFASKVCGAGTIRGIVTIIGGDERGRR